MKVEQCSNQYCTAEVVQENGDLFRCHADVPSLENIQEPGVNDNLVKPAVTTLSARKSADWWRGEKLWRVSQHHMDTSVGS
jgi:hypothetical protein